MFPPESMHTGLQNTLPQGEKATEQEGGRHGERERERERERESHYSLMFARFMYEYHKEGYSLNCYGEGRKHAI